jgi:hypothetical protein
LDYGSSFVLKHHLDLKFQAVDLIVRRNDVLSNKRQWRKIRQQTIDGVLLVLLLYSTRMEL